MDFEPLEFIGRLTALIPRPHKNLVVYHGVLAARSSWRRRVIAHARPALAVPPAAAAPTGPAPTKHPRHRNHAWATVMRRAFAIDVLACPRCAGRLELVACITQPAAIRAILGHLSLPTGTPEPQPARAPPWAHAADGSELADYDRYDAIDDDPDAVA